jgi:hypothetical protein
VPPTLVPPQPLVGGPLAARWLWHELPDFRAGVIRAGRAEIENAGSAVWRPDGEGRICVSYHWLDPLGNPIVWAGFFSPIPREVAPGEKVELEIGLSAPIPPGRYRLSLDLVSDGRCWFAELGNRPLELEVEVGPRITARTLAADIRPGPAELEARTAAALRAQEEPLAASRQEAEAVAYLAPGCMPAPDWSRRVLDAHEEGYAAVGGSIEPAGGLRERRRLARELEPWAPGSGRKPAFEYPLVCPSVVAALDPAWDEDVAGLPALRPPREPWLYDGRIRLKLAAV